MRRDYEFNPFMHTARMLKAEGFTQERNPYPGYSALIECLKRFTRTHKGEPVRVRISFEAASLLARLVLLGQPLNFISYICVSDYVGGTRFREQKGKYALSIGEKLMLERAEQLREEAGRRCFAYNWRLILADGWGSVLFGDRCEPGALNAYCEFMSNELRGRGFEAVRWSELMARRNDVYREACTAVEQDAEKLAPWEAKKGEIAHDKPKEKEALRLAKEHILMRAAEGSVILREYGPTLVLSAESRKLARYDNLLVPRRDYAHVFVMPFYPHRLP